MSFIMCSTSPPSRRITLPTDTCTQTAVFCITCSISFPSACSAVQTWPQISQSIGWLVNRDLCGWSQEWELRLLWFLAGQKKVDANSMMESHEWRTPGRNVHKCHGWGTPPTHPSLLLLALKAQPVVAPVPGFLLGSKFTLEFLLHSSPDKEQFENVGQGLVQHSLCFPASTKGWMGEGKKRQPRPAGELSAAPLPKGTTPSTTWVHWAPQRAILSWEAMGRI